jgi:hypothetical protein
MIAAAGSVVIAATLALWAHYGIFYEMIAGGISACV